VLLAPTEVLAVQHFQTIRDLLGPLVSAGGLLEGESGVGPNVGVSLLTGSVSGKARDLVLEQIASGAAGIVVGTHALLEGTVQFRDLGLVVIDEQHRFGVEQRDALRARSGSVPHLLVMTATPIPRTVAMTVFGDLGVTILDSSPPGRGTVSTTWVNPVLRPSWIPRVWERVTEEVQAGRRAFVVCPAIEPGEVEPGTHLIADQNSQVGQLAFAQQMLPGLENQPENGISATSATGSAKPLAAVSQVLERLESEPILQGARLAPLHGRMSSTQKDQTMAAFQAGEIDVLVATTVIEVGIDVPEATALVVLDADRFGLSQLHQLRGRVGRGSTPAVCLLVSEAEPGTPAALRLEAMERTTNGFELAEVDLQTRREGQILGDTQSGSSSLRLVRLAQDAELVLDARAAAEQIVTSDPDLTEYPRLRFEVDRLLAGREAYLERG
ncbi:MAG: DEAD/DEAH box helicase, partial [Bifidobacteriaceae bacterium]|nr:DEAD/DEAH box helicase [Bifidobacteriaceae bacterium]